MSEQCLVWHYHVRMSFSMYIAQCSSLVSSIAQSLHDMTKAPPSFNFSSAISVLIIKLAIIWLRVKGHWSFWNLRSSWGWQWWLYYHAFNAHAHGLLFRMGSHAFFSALWSWPVLLLTSRILFCLKATVSEDPILFVETLSPQRTIKYI